MSPINRPRFQASSRFRATIGFLQLPINFRMSKKYIYISQTEFFSPLPSQIVYHVVRVFCICKCPQQTSHRAFATQRHTLRRCFAAMENQQTATHTHARAHTHVHIARSTVCEWISECRHSHKQKRRERYKCMSRICLLCRTCDGINTGPQFVSIPLRPQIRQLSSNYLTC